MPEMPELTPADVAELCRDESTTCITCADVAKTESFTKAFRLRKEARRWSAADALESAVLRQPPTPPKVKP